MLDKRKLSVRQAVQHALRGPFSENIQFCKSTVYQLDLLDTLPESERREKAREAWRASRFEKTRSCGIPN